MFKRKISESIRALVFIPIAVKQSVVVCSLTECCTPSAVSSPLSCLRKQNPLKPMGGFVRSVAYFGPVAKPQVQR